LVVAVLLFFFMIVLVEWSVNSLNRLFRCAKHRLSWMTCSGTTVK